MYFLDETPAVDAIIRVAQGRIPLITEMRPTIARFVALAYRQGLRLTTRTGAAGYPVPTDSSWWLYNEADAQIVLTKKAKEAGLPSFLVSMVLREAVPAFYRAGYALMAPNPARRERCDTT